MTKPKYTEAQREANERWRKKHRERTQYLNKRSITKHFIADLATDDDLREVQKWVLDRVEQKE
ncbi:hypothetical protein [Lentilactobacillus kisonensis]|uniref:Uncharacterized protein n=1 Tax=Lentilactobacillus kisonensis DSM 19906 = JCM 15041 TaxID=1423766 RepID=A0A0R1NP99_9LACO|nr:hypothetical protein [Lentilactobacillus kisonensis]KRL20100.1 hypothetical protein FC98_GL001892 [Lentilactobacillus kisonensis DSM 19906 = JCM 15041]